MKCDCVVVGTVVDDHGVVADFRAYRWLDPERCLAPIPKSMLHPTSQWPDVFDNLCLCIENLMRYSQRIAALAVVLAISALLLSGRVLALEKLSDAD